MPDTINVTVFVAVDEDGEALADTDRDELAEKWAEQHGTTLGVVTYELNLTIPKPGLVRVGVSVNAPGAQRLKLVED